MLMNRRSLKTLQHVFRAVSVLGTAKRLKDTTSRNLKSLWLRRWLGYWYMRTRWRKCMELGVNRDGSFLRVKEANGEWIVS